MPYMCFLQDLVSQTLIGEGKLFEGLYYFEKCDGSVTKATIVMSSTLWHHRLGHASHSKLN